MKSYQIEDIKEFMNNLLMQEKYDSFYLFEARIKTALDYYINGRVNREFFDTDELIKQQADSSGARDGGTVQDNAVFGGEYVLWKQVKHMVFELVKGKRLPLSFKLVLMFHRDNIIRLAEMNNLPIRPEDVSGLFMNVYYENGVLSVTTGTSLKIFTLDKTLETLWDESVEKYYI